MNNLLTVEGAANYLNVSKSYIYHLSKCKLIPVVRFGRMHRYRFEDLDSYIYDCLILSE